MNRLTLLAVGDISMEMPDGDSLFDLVRPTLKSADILVGQEEVPFGTGIGGCGPSMARGLSLSVAGHPMGRLRAARLERGEPVGLSGELFHLRRAQGLAAADSDCLPGRRPALVCHSRAGTEHPGRQA